jgi:hypothetical protein
LEIALPGTRVKSRTGRWAVVAPNTEGKLAVTDKGAVYSVRYGRKLKPIRGNYFDYGTGEAVKIPYRRASYRVPGGMVRTVEIHRLVAWTFLGEPPRSSDGKAWHIHHIDGNPRNNRATNLEYVEPGAHSRITRNGNQPLAADPEPATGSPE